MIEKVASFNFTNINPLHEDRDDGNKMMRTAAGRVVIEPGSDKARILEGEVEKHPNALFFRAKAIEANCPNTNGDYFSVEELMDSYKSFEGCPFFTNHDNQNVENARGKVIFAEWVPEEEAVYTICFIDRDAYPHICRSIEEEYVTGVSMGCSVDYSVCNICGNKAERTEDYCTHIRNRKGRKFTGKARNVTTGDTKDFRDEVVFEYNYGLKFIELSAVVDPACPSCHIEGIISNDNYLAKVASMENDFRMIRTAAIEKEASQEEIDQIEQCLTTLEQIAINLIQNRKQVEMEFSSDLVKIMSDLQTWSEELVGAGYGNIGGDVPGTVGDMEGAPGGMEGMGAPGEMPPQGAPAGGPMPAASTSPAVGTISGSPSTPATSSPKLPITAPVKPRTSSENLSEDGWITVISDDQRIKNGKEIVRKASDICDRISKTGEIEMAARRTIEQKQAQKENAIEVLSNSWEEKQSFFEYIKKVPSIQNNDHRLSVNKRDDSFIIVAEAKDMPDAKTVWTYEDLTEDEREEIKDSPKDAAIKLLDTFAKNLNKQKEGVKEMTDIKTEAGAKTVQETPDQVQEKQLERSDLYHARTNNEIHDTQEVQLDSLRKGEKDYITENQLNDSELKLHKREGDAPDVVQEAQLKGDNRLEDDKHSITQKQLSDEGQRVDNEQDVITEKQLDNISAPWARVAGRNPALFKSATEHMSTVLDVMAESSIKSGCTPEEACKVAASLVDSVQSRYNLAVSLLESSKPREDIDYAKRVAYWQNRNLKVASAGTKEIAEIVVDGLRVYASDETYNPDVLIDAIDVISEGEAGIDGISTKIEEKLAETNKVEAKVNRKDELRAALSPKKEETSTKKARDEDRKQLLASIKDESDAIINKGAIKNADTVIATSFKELGSKKNSPDFKKDVVAFTKGALATQGLRMASITNVTISGDTIQIAVQTDTEENEVNIDTGEGTTEIPIGGSDPLAPAGAEQVPEGDLAGEGLEGTMGQGGAWASSKKKMTREAQSPMGGGIPGGQGDGMASGAPEQGLPGGSPEGDPIQALTTDSADGEEIPTAGEKQMPWTVCPECGSTDVDVTNESGDIKGSCNACTAEYEAMLKKTVEFKIIKPTKSVGEEGVESPDEPVMPEVPALPVAAQTNLGKDSLIRIANNRKQHGHVCPACGTKKCKASHEEDGHIEFTCEACGTDVEKDIMVSASNPENGVLRVKWDVTPDVENCDGCREAAAKFASEIKMTNLLKTAAAGSSSYPMSSCMERLARKYGGDTIATFGPCKGKILAECACKELQKLGFRKVRHLNKFASISMEKDPLDECLEDQTKNEGHTIKEAEAICGCIKKRFASEWMQNVYAQAFGEDIESGVEKDLTALDLETLNGLFEADKAAAIEAEQKALVDADEIDISEALPAPDSIEVEAEVEDEIIVEAKGFFCDKCKNPKASCKCDDDGDDDKDDDKDDEDDKDDDKEASVNAKIVEATSKCCCSDGKCECGDNCDKCKCDGGTCCASTEKEIVEAAVEAIEADEIVEVTIGDAEELKLAMSMDGKRVRNTNEEVFKMASTPKQVEDIEGNVEAGVPRSKATIRNEGADNIDVPMAKPSVPRANAEMGHEGADNINPKAGLPEVPVDSSYMGHEKEVQGGYDHANKGKGMPEINNEIKGTVIAEVLDSISKDADMDPASRKAVVAALQKQAKKMKEVDTVEGDVEAGVPRSNATIRNEGADNIDVPMAKPSVPRANAEMGHEGADNINPKAEAPDVPVGDGYMGHEKEVQDGYDHANRGGGMPGTNDEILKQVQQKRQMQMDRISQARKNEAIQATAWLVANRRIASDKDTFNTVVQSLMGFETDQIPATAERMFPEKETKTASAKPSQTVEASGYSIPAIILEPKPMSTGGSDELTDRLSNAFTIGNTKFDKDLTIYGEK